MCLYPLLPNSIASNACQCSLFRQFTISRTLQHSGTRGRLGCFFARTGLDRLPALHLTSQHYEKKRGTAPVDAAKEDIAICPSLALHKFRSQQPILKFNPVVNIVKLRVGDWKIDDPRGVKSRASTLAAPNFIFHFLPKKTNSPGPRACTHTTDCSSSFSSCFVHYLLIVRISDDPLCSRRRSSLPNSGFRLLVSASSSATAAPGRPGPPLLSVGRLPAGSFVARHKHNYSFC